MAITFSCSSCKQGLKVKDELAGRSVKCPKCAKVTKVPAPEPEPAADPELRIIEEEPAPAPAPVRASRPRAAGPMPPPRRRGSASAPASDGRYLLQGAAGGVAAAILGAFVWYMIVKGIKMRIGWVAWGIGGAAGFGVVLLSGGRGGAALPFIGAGAALLGWLLGEYMIYSWVTKEISAQGSEAMREFISQLSFGDYLQASVGLKGGFFVLLAVATGWGVPQKMAAD
ncbi:MAG TPA: hypothetical protein VJB14_05540 [Planctomycetota bacterium]|nr:hypothetical protein [Planctomycetota bacterium]